MVSMVAPISPESAATSGPAHATRLPFRWLLASGRPAAFLVAALLLQVAAPFAAFLGEPPQRFGFQMYAGTGGAWIEAHDADGKPVKLEWSSLIAGSLRPELDWTDRLPEHVCLTVPGVATVTVEQPRRERTISCD